jgi:hypothetical protein
VFAETDLPALSVQLPLRLADAESGPAYVTGAVHEAIPEKEWPLKAAVTGWLYQPFASGGRARAPPTVGVEASTFSGKLMS